MADLDLLRNINNTYGHLAGDEVLVKIGSIFKEAVREYDVVARFGGEEFAILMPEADAQKGFERAEKIRQTIEKTPFVIPTSVTPINVTISIGIAGRERFNQPAQEIIHNADTALYHSKLKGRNQTYVCANQTYASFLPGQSQGGIPMVPADNTRPSQPIDSAPEEYKAAEALLVRPGSAGPESHRRGLAANGSPAAEDQDEKGTPVLVDIFIGAVVILALLLLALVAGLSPLHPNPLSFLDWIALAMLAVFVVLTEWFWPAHSCPGPSAL